MKERFEAKEQEACIKKIWENCNVYAFLPKAEQEKFTIDTPPPTVSGSLHIGHIFSYLHIDFTARYQRMTGKAVFFPMGFDNNGLPTEKFVEKQRKIRSKELGRADFIKACLEECEATQQKFKNLWQSIGLSVDWNYLYSTISPQVTKVSQTSFVDLFKKGLIYRKKEPALFCTDFRTSVSQADLEVVSKESTFNTLRFIVEDGSELRIATTRPELLCACVAIFVNPNDARYQHLVNKKVKVPLFGQDVPVLFDDAAQIDKGTGAVMCCTFGDHQDILWFKNHKLALIEAIGQDGRMTAAAGSLAGLKVAEARKKVLEELAATGDLLEQKKIVHDVHVYERSKKEIEYIVLNQWFTNVLDFKDKFLEQGDKINWHPKFMKVRYNDWVKNLTWDWCISRQRYFGIPVPVWYCLDCTKTLVPSVENLPIDPQVTSYPGGCCDECGSKNLSADTDVLDTWATSALTPQICKDMLKGVVSDLLPMSIRPQAHDIIRTWAFVTIVKAYHEQGVLPWQNILISGHVLSSANEKISKSANNSQMEPEALIASHSADGIRYWAAKGRLGVDTAFSVESIKNGQRLVTKLWNALKFCKENINFELVQANKDSWQPNDVLSRWVFHKLAEAKKAFHDHFASFEYSNALDAIDNFFWHTFCDNYLEIVKGQIFNPEQFPDADINSSMSLYILGLELLELYAPFVPFITESLYQSIFALHEKDASLHGRVFSGTSFASQTILGNKFEEVVSALGLVRKLKSENSLSLKTEIHQLVVAISKPSILEEDMTAVNLLLAATKSIELVVQRHAKPLNDTKNYLEVTDAGLLVKIHLE